MDRVPERSSWENCFSGLSPAKSPRSSLMCLRRFTSGITKQKVVLVY